MYVQTKFFSKAFSMLLCFCQIITIFKKFSLKICYFGVDDIFIQKNVLYMQVGRKARWDLVVGKQTKIICFEKKENQPDYSTNNNNRLLHYSIL
jgi:hypothetical protein